MSDRPLTPECIAEIRERAALVRSFHEDCGEGCPRFDLADDADRLLAEIDRLTKELTKVIEDERAQGEEVARLTEERDRAWSVRDRLDKQFSEQLAEERAGREQAEQERDSLRLELEAERHVHRRDNAYLIQQRDDASAQVRSLLGRGNQG